MKTKRWKFALSLLVSLMLFAVLPWGGVLLPGDGLGLAYGFYIYLPGLVVLPIVFGIILGRQAGRWDAKKIDLMLWAVGLFLLHLGAYCLPQVLWCLTSGTDLWYAFDLFYLLSAVGLGTVFFAASLLTRT
ncbi:MAG TPA: hypothetical protein IAB36_01010 [Candidatus Egerieicola pullicola]|uniref:Transmembrane protein n=1 Tax=Candidatus Egerieicola pullicola TaxID=2840775 RepID=A0A9D1DBY8_9FIRM|nr:hypothetical protein [Candidatus Egerieicola pullicola]